MNTKRHHGKSQWYEYLLNNKFRTESSMEFSRSGTNINLNSSQTGIDKISWIRTRISSASKPPLELPSTFKSNVGISKNCPDIEEFINISSSSRPGSVVLGKYTPLPAISNSASNLSNSSDHFENRHKSIDPIADLEDNGEQSSNTDDNVSTDIAINPPKLVRSRTFEVIETNLDSLPVINYSHSENNSTSDFTEGIIYNYITDDDYTDDELNSETLDDNDISNMCATDDYPLTKKENKCLNETIAEECSLCVLNVDGIPLTQYIAHEGKLEFHNGMSIMDILDGHSRPPSRTSLITHQGSPESIFSMRYRDRVATADITHKSSRSSIYTVGENEEFYSKDSEIKSDYIYIKFPGDNLIALPWTREETVKELVEKIENLELYGKPIKICDLKHLTDELLQPLGNFGIDQNSTINLLLKVS